MHTLSLYNPDDNWYMDSGATSHMTTNPGTLTSYSSLSNHNGIIVDNGSTVPIRCFDHTSLSHPNPNFRLPNVLHAPSLVKNLISVHKFTTDNHVSIEFDPYGFSS